MTLKVKVPRDGKWHHLIANVEADGLKIYVDGEEAS